MKTLPKLIATVGFVGYAPLAPGTAGSLVAGLAFLLFPTYLARVWIITGLAVLFVLAVWSAHALVRPGRSDPQEVVIDEVMGMAVTVAFLPLTPIIIGLGFVLFRIFDILKPFPARQAEKFPGGWGIVLDDVIAGIFAHLSLRIIMLLMELLPS